MSFLAPLFLFGALAIGLPFLFHLARRVTREQQPFSSLMFLRRSPPRLTRRSRLEHLLLLALRCLVIIALAIGFARPFLALPPEDAQPVQQTLRTVLLVDTSASMRRENLWDLAQDRAREILQQGNPGDPFAILTFDRTVQTRMSFQDWAGLEPDQAPDLALQRLLTAEPSWHTTDLGNALVTAAELLIDSQTPDTGGEAQRIVLISDLQEGGRLEALQGYEWPGTIAVDLESLTPRNPGNAGIHWLSGTLIAAEVSEDNHPRIRISNSADATREQFSLSWTGSPTNLPVHVAAGQSLVVRPPTPGTATSWVSLELSEDPHPFDNTVHVLLSQPEALKVLYIGTDEADDSRGLHYYLDRAFPTTRQRQVTVEPGSDPASTTSPSGSAVRLVVLDGLGSQSSITSLREHLSQGGTALLVLRSTDSLRQAQALTDQLAGVTIEEARVDSYAMLSDLDFTHPVLSPFADARFRDFTKIRFWKHRRLAMQDLPGAVVLARFDSNDPALIELPVGEGRLMILTSSWAPEDSQLALSSKFAPLLNALLEYAGGQRPQRPQYRVGDSVAPPSQIRNQALTVQHPDGTETRLAAETGEFVPQSPGPHAFLGQGQPLPFVVNLDPRESQTTPLDPDQLDKLGVPLSLDEAGESEPAWLVQDRQAAELEQQQKLWRWLILAALVLLLLETWIAGRAPRQSLTTETAT